MSTISCPHRDGSCDMILLPADGKIPEHPVYVPACQQCPSNPTNDLQAMINILQPIVEAQQRKEVMP